MGLRLGAIAAAVVVGGGLSLAGLLLQTLLRNPLASPYILGLSSGAGLGVAAAGFLAAVGWLPAMAREYPAAPALLGATGSLVIVYGLGQRRGWLDPVSLVLVGVVVSALCSALIMLLQHLSPVGVVHDIVRWMFGHLPQAAPPEGLAVGAAVVVATLSLSIWQAGALDASLLSDDEARTIGVALGPLRVGMFVAAAALTATAVALAGPIGFIGIVGPHLSRLVVGHRHRILAPATALCGVALVLAADIGIQAIYLPSGRLPIGVVTALIGGPVFLWLLRTMGVRRER
jgi:iron complex transport system permease protein